MPIVGPPKLTRELKVRLTSQLWDELAEAAQFETEVWALAKFDKVVSRNDLIEKYLLWALKEYWEEKDGKPTSREDRASKAKAAAEALRRERR